MYGLWVKSGWLTLSDRRHQFQTMLGFQVTIPGGVQVADLWIGGWLARCCLWWDLVSVQLPVIHLGEHRCGTVLQLPNFLLPWWLCRPAWQWEFLWNGDYIYKCKLCASFLPSLKHYIVIKNTNEAGTMRTTDMCKYNHHYIKTITVTPVDIIIKSTKNWQLQYSATTMLPKMNYRQLNTYEISSQTTARQSATDPQISNLTPPVNCYLKP